MIFMMVDDNEDCCKIERLYQQYGRLMHTVANNILDDPFLAEDAVQQALIKIIDNLHKINEEDCHRTRNYLVIISRNEAINIYNKRKNAYWEEELKDNMEDEYTPEQLFLNKESVDVMADMINTLPLIYRDTLMLKYFQKCENSEIAEIMHVTEETVRQRISRGKRMLAKLIEGSGLYEL